MGRAIRTERGPPRAPDDADIPTQPLRRKRRTLDSVGVIVDGHTARLDRIETSLGRVEIHAQGARAEHVQILNSTQAIDRSLVEVAKVPASVAVLAETGARVADSIASHVTQLVAQGERRLKLDEAAEERRVKAEADKAKREADAAAEVEVVEELERTRWNVWRDQLQSAATWRAVGVFVVGVASVLGIQNCRPPPSTTLPPPPPTIQESRP